MLKQIYLYCGGTRTKIKKSEAFHVCFGHTILRSDMSGEVYLHSHDEQNGSTDVLSKSLCNCVILAPQVTLGDING